MQDLRYTNTAIVLHWIIAVMVLVLLGLGWYMSDLPTGRERSTLIRLHKTIGISVFLLMLVRVSWRAKHRPPPLTSGPDWQIRFAHYNHLFLYAFLFIQPLSGYLSSSFSGYGTRYLGIDLPQWGWEDERLNTIFNTVHQYSGMVLAGLIFLHFLGAMTHLYIHKDSVMHRMVPRSNRRGPGATDSNRLSA